MSKKELLNRALEEKNRVLENIVSNIPGHLYWLDKNNIFKGCNDQQAKMLGLSSSDEIIGKTPYSFLPKEKADNLIKNNNLVMKTKESHHFEESFPLLQGKAINFVSYKKPLLDQKGNVVGVLGLSIDMTEQAQRKKELEMTNELNHKMNRQELLFIEKMKKEITGQKSKKQQSTEAHIRSLFTYLNNIIALAPGHIYWKDSRGQYLGCNNNLAKAIGLSSRSDIIGMTDKDIAKKLSWPIKIGITHRKQDLEVMKSGRPKFNIESSPLRKVDGTTQILLGNKVPLKNEEGNIIGILGISIDITELKKIEESLKIAKNKAEEANIIKDQFIQNMEHDLRTPASGIAALAELLAASETDAEKKESLTLLASAGQRLLHWLNNILEFTPINYGVIPILEKKLDIKKTVKNIIDLETPSAKIKKLKLSSVFSINVPNYVIGDEFRIGRILINLVSNAIKFTNHGFVHIIVEMIKGTKNRDDDFQNTILKITVKDSGIGIPRKSRKSIFEKFTRLIPSNTGEYPGSGLGLYVVKQFVHELGGTLELKSTLGRGASFSYLIPIRLIDVE